MYFNAGFWLEEKAFFVWTDASKLRRISRTERWIELNDEPLESDLAWDAGEEPPALFSRKLWLEESQSN